MPRALAIETSGRLGSLAIVDGSTVVAEETFPHGLKHAADILPIIDRLIRARGWSPRDLEHLYISIGPGSFTGLRIAVTLAKTMALATGVKLIAVPTLQVLPATAPPEAKHLIILLDAKRDQIFTARFERPTPSPGTPGEGRGEGEFDRQLSLEIPNHPHPTPLPEYRARGTIWIEQEPPHLDSLTATLARSPRPVHLLGEGIPYHEKFIPVDPDVIITPEESWRARATCVAQLGLKLADANQFADPFKLTPIYIRKPEAEEKYEQSHPG
jgi:tRNA threonylcarbamoyladenosine biosynthesis protein TsaB